MAPPDLAVRLFETLRQTTSDPPGVTRASYGPGEQQAHDLARLEAERLGLEALNDAAGNLDLTWRGTDPARSAIMVGAHMDSVPHGGNFDGAAGVVAGLAAVARLQGEGIRLPRSSPMRVSPRR